MMEILFCAMLFAVTCFVHWVNRRPDAMVGQKQREIEALQKRCADFEDSKAKIYMTIYGMGGPLNDNVKGYTREQMKDFHDIIEDLNFVSDESDV